MQCSIFPPRSIHDLWTNTICPIPSALVNSSPSATSSLPRSPHVFNCVLVKKGGTPEFYAKGRGPKAGTPNTPKVSSSPKVHSPVTPKDLLNNINFIQCTRRLTSVCCSCGIAARPLGVVVASPELHANIAPIQHLRDLTIARVSESGGCLTHDHLCTIDNPFAVSNLFNTQRNELSTGRPANPILWWGRC